jgi:hypothetical protein
MPGSRAQLAYHSKRMPSFKHWKKCIWIKRLPAYSLLKPLAQSGNILTT